MAEDILIDFLHAEIVNYCTKTTKNVSKGKI